MQAIPAIGAALQAARGPLPSFFSMVTNLFLRYFPITTNSCFLGLGAKEFVWDGCVKKACFEEIDPESKAGRVICKIRRMQIDLSFPHGGLFLASGVCGVTSALHGLEAISLGILAPVVELSCNALFLFANILALGFHIKYVCQIAKCYRGAQGAEREVLKQLLISFITGIISNIAYIIAMAALIFGGPVAMVIVFAGIGVTFGAFKILYDLFKIDLGVDALKDLFQKSSSV